MCIRDSCCSRSCASQCRQCFPAAAYRGGLARTRDGSSVLRAARTRDVPGAVGRVSEVGVPAEKTSALPALKQSK
eukprot:15117546-Alexandrium_andersonii.AAC.1